uniref:DDE Tnp4 domain-containing protein n=2 Tax=Clytia hemisphaerica TaxID=252671 RepID=A0A7M5XN08_9CNID
ERLFFLLWWNYKRKNAQRRSRRKFSNFIMMYRAITTRLRSNLLQMQNCMLLGITNSNAPRYWAQDYEQNWFETMWENRNNQIFSEFWYKEFRMRPETFEFIVELVRAEMERRDTTYRRSIPVEKRVAVSIWRLSNGASYRTVSKTFGVGKTTIVEINQDFVIALLQHTREFIHFPETELETAIAIEKFHESAGCELPQVVGAIDGTHMEILKPDSESRVDYFSRKRKYTIMSQGVVGANSIFLDFVTGFPGSIHDARALQFTDLFRKAENETILTTPKKVIDGMRIRPLILGDGAYPASTWLLKPYPHIAPLDAEQRNFNRALSSSRCTVEIGFGLLKSRWRCLLKRLDYNLENIPGVVMVCVVLHNICQIRGDSYISTDDVLENAIRRERVARRERRQLHDDFDDGNALREHLKEYLS